MFLSQLYLVNNVFFLKMINIWVVQLLLQFQDILLFHNLLNILLGHYFFFLLTPTNFLLHSRHSIISDTLYLLIFAFFLSILARLFILLFLILRHILFIII
jgi:hypothetical protein